MSDNRSTPEPSRGEEKHSAILVNAPPQSTLTKIGEVVAPEAPTSLDECGIDPDVLADHTLRMAYTLPQFTTAKAAQIMCLPMTIVTQLLERLRGDKLIENLGQAGPIDYRFAVTNAGRERGKRLFEMTCYVGPSPVALEAYTANLEEQLENLPPITPSRVEDSISDLVLPKDARDIAGLAGSSMRSFFIYGPPGNGKTSLGHLLHKAMEGELWIPHSIGIDNSIIRIFDPRFHIGSPFVMPKDQAHRLDRRWVRIRRPFVVVGGELTVAALDLGYSSDLGYYEAPLHLKANGGTFLLDDLGFQKDEAHDILARWIYPLENHVDYLSLQTGQKIQVPFRQKLVVSTNMDPDSVMNTAFLRRMGYRLYLGDPTPEAYTQIFHEYAVSIDVDVPPGLTDWLLEKYKQERRSPRACEPRDLIERARDLCHFRQEPMRLNRETLRLAWRAYFGNDPG